MRDEQHVKTVFVLIGDAGIEVGVGFVPGSGRGTPAQETGDAMDVSVDSEALAAETEE